MHENLRPVRAELSVRTDRHNEANNRFSQFFERFQVYSFGKVNNTQPVGPTSGFVSRFDQKERIGIRNEPTHYYFKGWSVSCKDVHTEVQGFYISVHLYEGNTPIYLSSDIENWQEYYQERTNPRRQVAVATNIFTVAPKNVESAVRKSFFFLLTVHPCIIL